jgi:hypothetical protein
VADIRILVTGGRNYTDRTAARIPVIDVPEGGDRG